MEAVQYVLVYAALMSVWWVLMKTLTNMKFPNNLIRFASGVGAGMLVVWSLVQHGGVSYLSTLPALFWYCLAGTVVLNVILAYVYLKALEKSPASVAVHVTLLSPVVAVFTSYAFGIDRLPGWMTAIGIATVLTGLYVLHFNPRKSGGNLLGPIMEIWHQRGQWLWYMLANAVIAGCSIPLDKQCVRLSDYALAPGLTLFISWGLVYGLAAYHVGDFQKAGSFPRRKVVLCVVALAIVFGIANGFQAQAYNYQYAAAVASLKRLDAPFTVLWACFIFREEEKKNGHLLFRILGSLTAFLGAALIGFAKI